MAKKRKSAPDAPEVSLVALPQGYDVFLSDLKERLPILPKASKESQEGAFI